MDIFRFFFFFDYRSTCRVEEPKPNMGVLGCRVVLDLNPGFTYVMDK
jgi:hypothetical protein